MLIINDLQAWDVYLFVCFSRYEYRSEMRSWYLLWLCISYGKCLLKVDEGWTCTRICAFILKSGLDCGGRNCRRG